MIRRNLTSRLAAGGLAVLVATSIGCKVENEGDQHPSAPRVPAQHQGHATDAPAPNPDPKASNKGGKRVLKFSVRWDETTSPGLIVNYNVGHGLEPFPMRGGGYRAWIVTVNAGQTVYIVAGPEIPDQAAYITVKIEYQEGGAGTICTDTNVDHGGKGGVDCSGIAA